MWTRRPLSISRALGVALLGALVLASLPAGADEAVDLRARYPMSAPSSTTYAGFAIERIAVPGLVLKTRDDRTAERGGITLSFADERDQKVHVVVRIVVAKDAASARAFVDTILRGVSGVLAPSTLDEVAFADDAGQGDRFVVATRGNLAYVVDALDGATPAHSIAAVVKGAIASGALSFPQAKIVLPTVLDRADKRGGAVNVTAPAGARVRVRAKGGYVSHERNVPLVHAFAVGPVEVTALVTDALGRVSEVRASTVAR